MYFLKKIVNSIFPSNAYIGKIGSIDLNVRLAQFTGIPLLGLREESKQMKILIIIYGLPVTTIISFFYLYFEFYDLLLNGNNLEVFTQNFCLLLTHIAGTAKLVNCLLNLKRLQSIVRNFERVTKKYVVTQNQRKVFNDGEFETKSLLLVYIMLVTFTAYLGMVLMFRNPIDVAGKIFPYRVKLPAWLPLEVKLLYSGLAVWILALQIVACDYLNITFINQLRYQLMVLNLSFENLMVEEDQLKQSVMQEKMIDYNQRLHAIILHHCTLRDISKNIEQMFRMPLLMQFLTTMIILSLSGFQALTHIGGSYNVILIYFYCGCIFCELGLYCWFGNEAYEQSKTLSTNAFSVVSWYLLDARFRNSLVIFLVNAQRPFLFTAGGFIGLTLPSFAGVLSKSYSFVAVLRQIYE